MPEESLSISMGAQSSKWPVTAPGVRLFAIAVFLLGAGAFVPLLRAWFSSEELVMLAVVQIDPFAIWWGRDRAPGFFRPLIPMISWGWYSLFGVSAVAFHGLLIGLHLVNSWLVGLIARGWVLHMPRGLLTHSALPVIAAALFWVWPSHSEPIGWIPGLTDVAAATPLLGSVVAYLAWRNQRGPLWLGAAIVGYSAALCTKEATLTLPGVIAVYEGMRAVHERRLAWLHLIGPAVYSAVMVVYLFFRRWLMGVFLGGYGDDVHGTFDLQRLHWAIAPNLSNAFVPVPGLSLIQRDVLVVAVVVAAGYLLWRASKKGQPVLPVTAAVLAALVLFLPSINLPINAITEGQRFAYIPSSLAVVSVVYFGALTLGTGRRLLVTAFVVAVACAITLGIYNYNWLKAGKVARKIVTGMAELPQARKIFVLATTDNYREAYIMPHSLSLAGQAVLGSPPSAHMPIATAVNYWTSQVKVRAVPTERHGQAGWLVSLHRKDGHLIEPSSPEHPTGPRLDPVVPQAEDFAEVRVDPDGIFVRLRDFDPLLDKVVYLDGGKWKVLN